LKLGLEVHREGLGYQSVHWQTSETLAYIRRAREELHQLPIYTNSIPMIPRGYTSLLISRLGACLFSFTRTGQQQEEHT
jgi:hypothetical protein